MKQGASDFIRLLIAIVPFLFIYSIVFRSREKPSGGELRFELLPTGITPTHLYWRLFQCGSIKPFCQFPPLLI